MDTTNQLENYKRELLTIDLGWANAFGILILIPLVLIFGIPYFLIWGKMPSISSISDLFHFISNTKFFENIPIFLIVFFIGIIIHELIHGFIWAFYTKFGFRSIKFGVLWKMLTPYCHCKEPLKVKQYIFGGIMPAIILGIIPSIISIVIGHLGLLVFGIFFTMAAAGDFLTIKLLIKEDMNCYVQDHPSEAGCYIYRKIVE